MAFSWSDIANFTEGLQNSTEVRLIGRKLSLVREEGKSHIQFTGVMD